MKQGTLAAAVVANLLAMPAAVALDQNLPAYKVVGGVTGQLKSLGSDTLGNAMALWAKGFDERYPDVKIAIEDKGSATAPPALLDGASQFGPMSRPMTSAESDAFEKNTATRSRLSPSRSMRLPSMSTRTIRSAV